MFALERHDFFSKHKYYALETSMTKLKYMAY